MVAVERVVTVVAFQENYLVVVHLLRIG